LNCSAMYTQLDAHNGMLQSMCLAR
jgi:hypothetical protein